MARAGDVVSRGGPTKGTEGGRLTTRKNSDTSENTSVSAWSTLLGCESVSDEEDAWLALSSRMSFSLDTDHTNGQERARATGQSAAGNRRSRADIAHLA